MIIPQHGGSQGTSSGKNAWDGWTNRYPTMKEDAEDKVGNLDYRLLIFSN